MALPDFEMAIGDLAKHCKAKLDHDQLRIMWNKMEHLPIKCIKWAADQFVGEVKQTKAAFPTIQQLVNRAQEYWKLHPADELATKEYDPIDDNDYPIEYLYNAYRTLVTVGPKMCLNYCEAHRMPLHDRIRVLNKGRVAEHIEGLADLITELEEQIGQSRESGYQSNTADDERLGDLSLEGAARHGMHSWSP